MACFSPRSLDDLGIGQVGYVFNPGINCATAAHLLLYQAIYAIRIYQVVKTR